MTDLTITIPDMPMGHRLLVHPGRCRFLHGHNYKLTLILTGTVDARTGMLVDFSDVKKIVKGVLDQFDHAMVVEQGDPVIPHLRDTRQRFLVIDAPPTAENLAQLWHSMLLHALRVDGRGVDNLTLEVYETDACSSTSYGLERHIHILEAANGL